MEQERKPLEQERCLQCGEIIVYLSARLGRELIPVDRDLVVRGTEKFNAFLHCHHRQTCALHYTEKRTCDYCGRVAMEEPEFPVYLDLRCCPECKGKFQVAMKAQEARRRWNR